MSDGATMTGGAERVFAVDAGGSSTRVVVASGGTMARHLTGSVNPASAEPALVSKRWAEILGFVTARIGSDCPGWIASASIGGADQNRELDRIRAAVALAGLSGPVIASNDLTPLLLAPPLSGNGFVLVAGTGSACLAAAGDRAAVRVGGQEYLISDEGSGYQIGLAGLRAALRAVQRTGPDTALATSLTRNLTLDLSARARQLATSPQAKTEVAAFAAQVIAVATAGDEVATKIVSAAAADLVSLVQGAALALETKPEAILACGSLMVHSAGFADLVTGGLLGRWPAAEIMLTADGTDQCLALAAMRSATVPHRGEAARWHQLTEPASQRDQVIVRSWRPATRQRPQATSQQPLVLVGCGAIMMTGHVPALAQLDGDCTVRAVVDLSPERRHLVGDRFGVPAAGRFDSWPAFAGQADDPMLAVVAVPTPVAAQTIAEAASAGHLVLAEKPVAATAAAARPVFESAPGRIRVVHNYLARSDVRLAGELIAAGVIGTPRLVRFEQLDPGHFAGAGPDPDWRLAAGRGCLLDNAYHWIYLAETLLGAPAQAVTAQVAGQSEQATPATRATPDTLALLTLQHSGGALTAVQVGWGPTRATKVIEAHGSEGSLRLLGGGSGCQLSRRGQPGQPEEIIQPPAADSSYLTFYRGVFATLKAKDQAKGQNQDQDFAASPSDCLHVLDIIDTAYRSAAEQRTLPVPPAPQAPQAPKAGKQ